MCFRPLAVRYAYLMTTGVFIVHRLMCHNHLTGHCRWRDVRPMPKPCCQWLEQDGTEPQVHSMEEADCLFFDRATRQYLTSGDPSSDLIKNMREALQVIIQHTQALDAQ